MADPTKTEKLAAISAARGAYLSAAAAITGSAGYDIIGGAKYHRHYGGAYAIAAGGSLVPDAGSHLMRSVYDIDVDDENLWKTRLYVQGSAPLTVPVRSKGGPQAKFIADYDLLDTHRSDIAAVARFSNRVDYATWHLCAAIDDAEGPDVWHGKRTRVRIAAPTRSWLGRLTASSLHHWQHIRSLLVHEWTPPEAVRPLYRAAFHSLCELTPADTVLKSLFEMNVMRACRELAHHVDLVASQIELAARLTDSLANEADPGSPASDAARLSELQEALLGKAGDTLSLTHAASRLKVSRQALHKRIKALSALGLMHGDKLLVPSFQFVKSGKTLAVVPHLKDVLALFERAGAGSWSALQFLVETDPTIGKPPIEALKSGQAALAVAAARAYLGLDEG